MGNLVQQAGQFSPVHAYIERWSEDNQLLERVVHPGHNPAGIWEFNGTIYAVSVNDGIDGITTDGVIQSIGFVPGDG